MASDTCSLRASEQDVHRPSVSFTWASALGQLVRSTSLSTAVDEHRFVCAPVPPTQDPGAAAIGYRASSVEASGENDPCHCVAEEPLAVLGTVHRTYTARLPAVDDRGGRIAPTMYGNAPIPAVGPPAATGHPCPRFRARKEVD